MRDRAKHLAAATKYRTANREKALAASRRWYARKKNDPEWYEEKKRKCRVARVGLPREASVEDYLVERVEAAGGLCIKFIDAAQRGAPDRLVILPGRPTFFVELKRPVRGRLEDHQKRYHQRLRDRGQRVWTLWSKADVDAFMIEVELT